MVCSKDVEMNTNLSLLIYRQYREPEKAQIPQLESTWVHHKSHIYGIHVHWVTTKDRKLQTLKKGQEEMQDSCLEEHPQTAYK